MITTDDPSVPNVRISVAALDSLSTVAAGALLDEVCGSHAWNVALVATRPHHTLDMVRTRSDEALAAIEWSDIVQALESEPEVSAPLQGDPPPDEEMVRERLATAVRHRLGEMFEDVDAPSIAPMWLSLDGAENVRDVGGLPTADGRHVRAGALLRADSLQDLSPTDVRRLVDDVHVTAVADLRTGVEITGEGPGPLIREERVTVVHLSLFPETGAAAPAAGPVILPWQARRAADDAGAAAGTVRAPRASAAEVYLGYLAERPDSILSTLRLITGTEGATIVHCAAGKDRTGTIVAIALSEVGVLREAIVEDYVRSAERIERIFRRLARRRTYAGDMAGRFDDLDRHRPRADTIRELLAGIDDRFGGVPTWLRANGWTDDDARALRAKLLD